MKLRAFAPRTETGKKFIKALEKLSYRHSVWNIWTDSCKRKSVPESVRYVHDRRTGFVY